MNNTHYDWTKRYKREPNLIERFLAWCRRHQNKAWFIWILAVIGTASAYLCLIGFIYLLVTAPTLQ